jgi:pimeloyl-ACP methyl ester carboxylesterase
MNFRKKQVDGITMRWLESGAESAPSVVLVHGIPTGPRLWRKVIPRVEGARVLAWEMVGFGDSIAEGVGRDIGMARQAGYLLSWMRSLGIERAVLGGHDLGGGVVQIAAVREPARCSGLLLTNAIAYDSWPIPSVKAMRALGAVVERLPDRAFRGIFAMFIARGHDDREVAAESADLHWRSYAAQGGAEAFVRQIRALDVRDTLQIEDALPALSVPARIVWGAADQFQKVKYAERLAGDLGAELTRIEGGKHFLPEDHPEPIAHALRQLVELAPRDASVRTGPHP